VDVWLSLMCHTDYEPSRAARANVACVGDGLSGHGRRGGYIEHGERRGRGGQGGRDEPSGRVGGRGRRKETGGKKRSGTRQGALDLYPAREPCVDLE
jgi:hypothetical protein